MPTDRVSVILDVDPSVLGLPRPPARVQLKGIASARNWSLWLRGDTADDDGRLLAWAGALGARRVAAGRERMLRLELDAAPASWSAIAQLVNVKHAILDPHGPARILAEGGREEVGILVEELRASGASVRLRHIGASLPVPPLLTGAQRAALEVAARAGYYDVPRPVGVRDIAALLGASAASTSERLRRAEGHVIRQYLEHDGLELTV